MDNKSQIPISVIVTTYNAAAFIRETIDSILEQTFQNFELLIGDDESEDNTCEIIESYHDSRIRLVRCKHDFIGTENRMLNEASGKYIARLDHDDRMLPDRLKTQYKYMETHPCIDVLGGSMVCFGSYVGIISHPSGHKFTVSDFIKMNVIFNPTVMIRRNTIVKYNLHYENEYVYADDYRLWTQMIKLGLHLENLPNVLTSYRVSSDQASFIHRKEQSNAAKLVIKDLEKWATRQETLWCEQHPVLVPESKNKLTLIIPFLNEGDEVINTVNSARKFVGNKVDIIVINDHSNDGYPYRKSLISYNVIYVYNKARIGVAASRDLGVKLCKTPFFLLLDAHMRFYDSKWVTYIINLLEKDDRRILCSQTKILYKDKFGKVREDKTCPTYYGAIMPFCRDSFIPDITWNRTERCKGCDIEPIAAILGAGYAGSKRYWLYLHGLEGLKYYGCDEAYISLKVWLEGGECILLKNVTIGHIYREDAPYRGFPKEFIYNYLLIAFLLFPPALCGFAYGIAFHKSFHNTQLALNYLNDDAVKNMRAYIKSIVTMPFEIILELNQIIDAKTYTSVLENKKKLPLIAAHIIKTKIENNGICNGKMGQLLFLNQYSSYCENSDMQNKAKTLLDDLLESVKRESDIDVFFRDGLSGIGWGLMFLSQNNMSISEEYVEFYLNYFDSCIKNVCLEKYSKCCFLEGVGGIYCYVCSRVFYCNGKNISNPFSQEYLSVLYEKAKEFMSINCDCSTLIAICQFIEMYEHMEEKPVCRLSINYWANYPLYLTSSDKYWVDGIEGCAGFGLMVIGTLKNNKLTIK